MGLYSTNRVASVYTESTDAIIRNTDWTPDFRVGSMMEACIEIHENDAKMFDSLIECDFLSSQNYNVMTEADAEEANKAGNEVKKRKITDKIKDIVNACINFLKKAASNFIAKIIDLVKSDEKIVSAYEKDLTVENLKNFKGIRDFAFPSGNFGWDFMGGSKSLEEVIDKMKNIETPEDVNKITDLMNSFIEDINLDKMDFDKDDKFYSSKDAKKENFGFYPKQRMWKPNAIDIKTMLSETKNGKESIKKTKEAAAKIMAQLKTIIGVSQSVLNKKDSSELSVDIANRLYNVASRCTKILSKEFSAYTRILTKRLAAYRKATILCGRAALKAAKGETNDTTAEEKEETNESINSESVLYALGESSDAYVFECLGY